MSETTNEATQEKGQESITEQAQTSTSAQYLFPHEAPSDHWNVDFGDGKKVYEGSALPVWILAGWAIFILWAVIYLVSGLPGVL